MASGKIQNKSLVTESVEVPDNIVIGPNTSTRVELDVTKSGYRPVGIVGWRGSGTTRSNLIDNYIDGNTAIFYVNNQESGTKTIKNFRMSILYEKSGVGE